MCLFGRTNDDRVLRRKIIFNGHVEHEELVLGIHYNIALLYYRVQKGMIVCFLDSLADTAKMKISFHHLNELACFIIF